MGILHDTRILIGAGSAVWLIATSVAGHYLWSGVPWIVVLLLAAMAELIVLTAWLLFSTFRNPVSRWDLPPNPATAQRGWQGAVVRLRSASQQFAGRVRQKVLRRAAKA